MRGRRCSPWATDYNWNRIAKKNNRGVLKGDRISYAASWVSRVHIAIGWYCIGRTTQIGEQCEKKSTTQSILQYYIKSMSLKTVQPILKFNHGEPMNSSIYRNSCEFIRPKESMGVKYISMGLKAGNVHGCCELLRRNIGLSINSLVRNVKFSVDYVTKSMSISHANILIEAATKRMKLPIRSQTGMELQAKGKGLCFGSSWNGNLPTFTVIGAGGGKWYGMWEIPRKLGVYTPVAPTHLLIYSISRRNRMGFARSFSNINFWINALRGR